ncbi:MAG: type VI secretion system ATPase TssH [Acidobacteriaceae bacterium]|nr:type VI secretion system ATPase TssH [Acidobacteriaceae bacterium]
MSLKSLIGKTNETTRSALEAAAGLCLSRTHYDVEIEHFLIKLLDARDSDFAHILTRFEIDRSRVLSSLNHALDKLKTGNGRTPGFSPHLTKILTAAWTLGSIDFGATQIRSGFAILALVSGEERSRILDENIQLRQIQPDVLKREFVTITATSPENAGATATIEQDGNALKPGGKTPNLDQYTISLTENAKQGKIDPVLGRDSEIRQIIDILMRRRQNNPILTGEAGVGKTAVVEGFAQRVVKGDVPAALKNVAVRTLDLALLQAGAGIKGEFENRLKSLIEEVKRSPVPIILFIDEAHTMIGAGGQPGQNDAANLLKPALARGELRTIAATTWSEYKKYFEKDPALARRFQVVKVEEPGEDQCMVMMRGVVNTLEKHHDVRILDEGLAAAVKLSHRYLAGRQLPDKAVSVLDTACARLSLGQNTTPAAIENLTRQIDDLEIQERIVRREIATGSEHGERLEHITQERKRLSEELDALKAKWERVKRLVQEIRGLRAQLETDGHADAERAALQRNLSVATDELQELQGAAPLTQVCVDSHIIGEVISGWTGIPVGKMMKDEIATILDLECHLSRRIIGQDDALVAISERIRTGRANLVDPGKPVGVFLLVGPSGVGKTETALALSDLLYGGEHNLITINMSEFQEAYTISTLKGAPPGYKGYGEGGVLTEAVRRRPYSVVLLDEVEKAHADVRELFYQVFDRGMMEDGEGREIDFKNTIILLTTNAGTDELMKLCANPDDLPTPDEIVYALKPRLNKIFKPAFLGRLVIVPYYPIRDESLKQIVDLKLKKIQRRMFENHRLELRYDDDVIDQVALRCTEGESGARNVDNILTNTLLPDISRQVLTSIAEGQKLPVVTVSVGQGGEFEYSSPASLAFSVPSNN